MARELLGCVNAPEQEIYRVAGDLADIALKAAAEIAEDFSWQLPLYESREANEASDDAACATCAALGSKRDKPSRSLSRSTEKD